MKYISTFALGLLLSAGLWAQGFSTTLSTEKKPWTAEPQVVGDTYKFIVLPDKTGGNILSIFEHAIDDMNALAPDFVINIGDLIGGYYTDAKYCERDWTDVMKRLERLNAPFFLVGGNHDLTNQLQTDDFVSRFGATYYSFSIGPDLFIVLDTEEHGGRDISDRQVEYFRPILEGWNGRHIYVFMHSPLWAPESHGGYEYIEEMLQGHQYTVFSGHTHQYYYDKKNGMDHFVVATAGGDSERRGPLFGEYDHLMLVSARDGGPVIANLPVGVILPNDIVDKNTMPVVQWMTSGRFAKVPYLMLESAAPEEFTIPVTVSNPFDKLMMFALTFTPANNGLIFSQSGIHDALKPNETREYQITVHNTLGVEPGKMYAKTKCTYELKGTLQTVEGKLEILTDCVRSIAKGQKLTLVSSDHYDIDESWDWHGPDDGRFEFDVENNGKEIVVSVRTHDDLRVLDKVDIFLQSGGKMYSGKFEPEEAVLKVPLKKIKDGQFTLNVSFTDNDDPEEGDPSVLWWRPGSKPGQFVISK